MTTEQRKLQGVWEVVERTTTGPSASTNSRPQPGLYIFAGSYYSLTFVNGVAPRTAPEDQSKATADQLREVLRFAAQAGTFETNGGDLVFKPVVALGVANMAPGATLTSSYRIDGNTLWLTQKSNQRGPVTNPSTVKLRRIQ